MSHSPNIKVSVLCLTYNHEKYIRETLEGFVMQKTNFAFEVLIHDDCSTDNTISIIREYESKYPNIIKPLYETENQYSKGVHIISDILVPLAQGKYLAFCEGDDYWNDKYKLQKQYDILEIHQECSMCTHKVQCCNEDGSPNERVLPEKFYGIQDTCIVGEDQLKDILFTRLGYPFHTSSYFVRKEIYDADIHFPRDIGIMRRSLYAGLTFYFNESMSTRRLWSIGNWNSRMEAAGVEGHVRLVLSDFRAEKQFDKDTGFIFHSAVLSAQLSRILDLSCYDTYGSRKLLTEYIDEFKKFHQEIFCNMKIKRKLAYLSLRFCPFPLKIYSWLIRKNRNSEVKIDIENLCNIG